MTLEQLEAEVLALPKDAQVTLLARLLERLGQNSEIDAAIAATWINEAEKRDEAMSIDLTFSIPAEVVFQRVRDALQ
jgi:hypothetical protein